jgi:hypothetical protein
MGGLTDDENSYPFTFQIVWVSGAAQLGKLMWFAIEMVAQRYELFMYFKDWSFNKNKNKPFATESW